MNIQVLSCLFLVFLISLSGCLNGQSKSKMFEGELAKLKGTQAYEDVKKSANDSLKKWLADDLNEVKVLNECNWKVDDAVFFNTKKDRAYLLLLLQDKDRNAELDYVYVMYGALEGNKWSIYFLSLPNLVFPRERLNKDKHQPVALSVLSQFARDEVLKGYYKSNVINDKYIDEVYTEDLRRIHARFLNPKIKRPAPGHL